MAKPSEGPATGPLRQPRAPSSVSIEDTGHDSGDVSVLERVYIGICYLFSGLFSVFYLSFLMLCALITSISQPSTNAARHLEDEWNQPPASGPNTFRGPSLPPLTKEQAVLTKDLRYYIKLNGYDLEQYTVTTQDGFNIELNRIVVPREDKETAERRYPVLMLHGLMQSSASFCTSGEHSLAFFLVKNGYDVWLGNNRCGFKPSHAHLKSRNLGMWSWRIQELGTLDLQCLVDHVRATRNVEKIAFVAHSQGTSQTFLALATDCLPELGPKLSCFVALSPAVYIGPLVGRWFLRFVKHFSLSTYRVFFGYHCFLPMMMTMSKLMSNRVYGYMGYAMFRFLFGWNDKLWDPRYRSRQLLFSPVYVSAELMYWWLGKGGFASRGCLFHHDSKDHPWFDSRFPPLQLVVPGADNMVDPYKLVTRIKEVEAPYMQRVEVTEIAEYSHLDVLWAANAIEKVGFPMLEFITSTRTEGNWLSVDIFH